MEKSEIVSKFDDGQLMMAMKTAYDNLVNLQMSKKNMSATSFALLWASLMSNIRPIIDEADDRYPADQYCPTGKFFEDKIISMAEQGLFSALKRMPKDGPDKAYVARMEAWRDNKDYHMGNLVETPFYNLQQYSSERTKACFYDNPIVVGQNTESKAAIEEMKKQIASSEIVSKFDDGQLMMAMKTAYDNLVNLQMSKKNMSATSFALLRASLMSNIRPVIDEANNRYPVDQYCPTGKIFEDKIISGTEQELFSALKRMPKDGPDKAYVARMEAWRDNKDYHMGIIVETPFQNLQHYSSERTQACFYENPIVVGQNTESKAAIEEMKKWIASVKIR